MQSFPLTRRSVPFDISTGASASLHDADKPRAFRACRTAVLQSCQQTSPPQAAIANTTTADYVNTLPPEPKP